MCGIVGFIDLKRRLSEDARQEVLLAMRDSFAYRGPDDAGEWYDHAAGCALGFRRLSIIDLRPEASQPMGATGAETKVTFNGEIYNFQEVRARLEAEGRVFNSRSDTEVLPFLFESGAPDRLAWLNGMFAIACWHPGRREFMLARDPFGKKPLYIYESENFLAYASELQAFERLPDFDGAINQDALGEYLLFGYINGPATIYNRVRMLPAGGFERLSVDNGESRTIDSGQFFEFDAHGPEKAGAVDLRLLKEDLRERLIGATERRLMSDVPLGAFLSGGVDSALVCAIVRKELGQPLDTFSIGFSDTPESEHEAAREIASYLGCNHHDTILSPDGIGMIEKIAQVLDQPNGDSSCLPTYLLSEFAREKVTVVLSGDGGDELFGGYGRYRDTLNELADPDKLRAVHNIDPGTANVSDLYMTLRWHTFLPEQASKLMGGLPEGVEHRLDWCRNILNDAAKPALHAMRTLDARLYMPGAVLAKVDRMSMFHSLEVRSPLLDKNVAEFAMALPQEVCWKAPDLTKLLLKELACDYLPAQWMHRKKKGFGLPANAWSMDSILSMCRELLDAPDTKLRQYVDGDALHALVVSQSTPNMFSIYQMWPLLILELWLRNRSDHRVAAFS